MRPVEVKGATSNFAKPRNWDEDRDGKCGTLSVRVEQYGIYNDHRSNWKPDDEELKLLNNGGVVELSCIGVQPPVAVSVVEEHKS